MNTFPWYSVTRLLRATGFALEGLLAAFRTEAAFRCELFAAILLIPTALFLPVSTAETMWLIASVFIVLLAELVNTAIETLTDYISTEPHPMAKRAKDIGAAIVLLSLVQWATVWALALGALWVH